MISETGGENEVDSLANGRGAEYGSGVIFHVPGADDNCGHLILKRLAIELSGAGLYYGYIKISGEASWKSAY